MAEMKKKPIDWITVKGNHVPIQKGQTKKEAVSKFFEDKKVSKMKKTDVYGEPISTGAISGASGALDPDSEEARAHALMMYPQIHSRKYDVYKISELTGFSVDDIKKVKEYIFVPTKTEEYVNIYGDIFCVSYEQEQSWERLTNGNPEPHDYTFLKHEIYELGLRERGYDYNTAHNLANKLYNYHKESEEYKEFLKKNGRIKTKRKK